MVGIHADGVQYTTSMRAGGARSIIVCSINCLSGASDKLTHQRHPLFVLQKAKLCKCGCQGYHTLQALFRVVAWSSQCLLRGRTPTCRHDGTPWNRREIKDKARVPADMPIPHACLVQIRGDWEWLCQFCRLRFFKTEHFCWMCNTTASPGDLCYTDFRPEAPHRQTLISHEDYVRSCVQEQAELSHVFRCPGTTLDHLTVDVMHAGDLGCFQDAIGTLFWLEVSNKAWHRTNAAGLQSLNNELKAYYRANSDRGLSQVTPLAMSQIWSDKPGYPFLKAKAAQTRHLSEFCLVLALRHQHGDANRRAYSFRAGTRMAGQGAVHSAHLVAMFRGLNDFCISCSAAPFNKDACKRAMYQFLQSLKAPHDLWRHNVPLEQQRPLPFHMRPKSHVLQHLVEDKVPVWGSPASFWCYRDEDFIGAVKGIAQKTKDPRSIELRILEKLTIWAKFSATDYVRLP